MLFRSLVTSNSAAFSKSGSNLVLFTEQMTEFSGGLGSLVDTNRQAINRAVKNLEASTITLTNILVEVQNGNGLAANLLKNDKLAADVSLVASNLSITSSNLNRLGLWGILWKKKAPREEHGGNK